MEESRKITIFYCISDAGYYNRLEMQCYEDAEIDEFLHSLPPSVTHFRGETEEEESYSYVESALKERFGVEVDWYYV